MLSRNLSGGDRRLLCSRNSGTGASYQTNPRLVGPLMGSISWVHKKVIKTGFDFNGCRGNFFFPMRFWELLKIHQGRNERLFLRKRTLIVGLLGPFQFLNVFYGFCIQSLRIPIFYFHNYINISSHWNEIHLQVAARNFNFYFYIPSILLIIFDYNCD